MSFDRRDALRIFANRFRSPELLIYEIGEAGTDSQYPVMPNSWFVRFHLESEPMVRPSRLVCISKYDGQVVYDGPAFDEG